ncbi:MAG: response regulator transcription factor [Clostridia bacterium]|nr:response regulator transcription factor [Clostridia bacterium]
MTGLRIVICDDLIEERKRLKNYIRRLEKDDNLELEITEFSAGEELIAFFKNGGSADLLFLDIYMNGINGVDTARTLGDMGYSGSVVFCTTSLDHAVESYRLKADGYLVKPYSYEDFLDAIWRCRRHFEKSKKSLNFVSERIDYAIPLPEVCFIETSGRQVDIHTADHTYSTYKKIGDFEKELQGEASFLKIGRCYIVNMNRITKISDDTLTLSDGTTLPLPVREKKRLQQLINDWFWQKTRGEHNG